MKPSTVYARMVRFLHATAQEGAAELRQFELSPAQYQTLVYVHRSPGVAQWQLVEAFGVTKGNVSQLVKKLEASGLLLRSRKAGVTELILSDEGQALVDRIVPAHDDFVARQFAALSDEELRTLDRLLRRLQHS